MRFIYQYRFVATVMAAGLLIAAIYHAVSSPEEDWKDQRVQVRLSQEDRDWIRENPVITVGVDLDFAPIEQLDRNQRYSGVTADFLHLISKETGLRFQVDKAHTWDQSLTAMRAGTIHMLGAAVPSLQRRQYMDFTQPYAWLSGVIIVRKTVSEPMTLEKLKGMKVAVVADYIWKDILEQSHPDLSLSPSQDIEAALKKVSFGMADAMVEYMATASHHIERLGISNLKISGDTLSVVDICFAVNKSVPQLTRILDKVLQQTPAGQKKAILRKWISLEFSKASNLKWLTRILFPAAALIVLGLVVIIIWNQSLQRQVVQRTEKLKRELIQRTVMEKALRENEEKYRSIFENIQDVYFEIRPLGKILEISPSVEKVFGYKREDLIYQSISRIFASLNEFRTMRFKAVRDDHLIDYETLLVSPDGRELNCSMNTSLVRDEAGNPVKIIGSIHNITERVKAQKALTASYNELEKRVRERTAELSRTNTALNQAKEAADAATRAKSNFLANMSHEIRTPLSGVISASELVMKEELPRGVSRYIDIIRTSGHALLSVIDDILDFSKIEAGKLDLEHHPFDLNLLIDRATGLFKHRFIEKEIRFLHEIDPDIPSHLKGDSFRIQQILTNLLSNAVKFTDRKGTINLVVSLSGGMEDGSDRARVQFLVEDSGIGISPAYQEVLFSPFAQEDASTTRKYGGSGLGLSICRQLVEAMDGTIRVESTPGIGSRFSFTLPLEIMPEPAPPPMALPGHTLSLGGFRSLLKAKEILVAEDTPTNQEIILAVLELVGARAVLAENGEEAVAAVSKRRFDAVLMDLQMPVMDGFAATAAIRKLDHGKDLPVIAMTAHALKEDEERCLAAGMDGYIAKPINQEKLFTTLVWHIYAPEGTAPPGPAGPLLSGEPEAQTGPPVTGALPRALPGIEIRRAIEILGVPPPVFLRILKTFYRDTPDMITQVKEAWLEGNREGVIRLIHSLKGAASGVGANDLHALALAAETQCREAETLPDMASAGLPGIETALDTVISSIQTLVEEEDTGNALPLQEPMAPSKEGLSLLEDLARALEFPEFTELETLMDRLAHLGGHPMIETLNGQIRSHDHDLARATVRELQRQWEGRQ